MAATMDTTQKERYGANGENVAKLIERLESLEWYSQVGNKDNASEEKLDQFMKALGVESYEAEWISKDSVPEKATTLDLEDSSLWNVLKDVPDQMYAKIEETGRNSVLEDIVYNIPELVYHGAFEGAYHTFKEEKAVSFLVGHAMYVSVLACAWEIIADQDDWKENPFLYVIEILEKGNLPLGPQKDTFFIS